MNHEYRVAFNIKHFNMKNRDCQLIFCNIIFLTCKFFRFSIDKSKITIYNKAEMSKGVHFRLGAVSCTEMNAFAFCFLRTRKEGKRYE